LNFKNKLELQTDLSQVKSVFEILKANKATIKNCLQTINQE